MLIPGLGRRRRGSVHPVRHHRDRRGGGIGLPLVWPRNVRTTDLTSGLGQIAGRLQQVYDDAARHLSSHPMTKPAASRWREATWQISPLTTSVASTLEEAEDVQKWNTQQLFRADVVPLLRNGLSSLARVMLATAHPVSGHRIGGPDRAHPGRRLWRSGAASSGRRAAQAGPRRPVLCRVGGR